MLPTFVIVGAQKAGTTSLWRYLAGHPDVFVPESKEPAFFAGELGWHLGVAWYEGLFAGAGEATALGEASTYYTMYPDYAGVPGRMACLVPDVRIVYLVRHPVDRMRSAYVQLLATGIEQRSMARALLEESRYVDVSRYAMQLEQYLAHFAPEQILTVKAEDLRTERLATVNRVLRFVGVHPVDEVEPPALSVEHNRSAGRRAPRALGRAISRTTLARSMARGRPIPPATARRLTVLLEQPLVSRRVTPQETVLDDELRRRLEDMVRPDVERLRSILGAEFDGWGLLS